VVCTRCAVQVAASTPRLASALLVEGSTAGLALQLSLSNSPVAPVVVTCSVAPVPAAPGALAPRVTVDARAVTGLYLTTRAPDVFRVALPSDFVVGAFRLFRVGAAVRRR
jgi:hypothetical protein